MEPENVILICTLTVMTFGSWWIQNQTALETTWLLLSRYQPLFACLTKEKKPNKHTNIWLKALKYAPTTFKMHRKGEELLLQIQALEERTPQSSLLRCRMQLPSLLLKFLIFWLILAQSWEAPCRNRLWKYSDMRQRHPAFILLFLPLLTADDPSWRNCSKAW